MCKSSDCFPQVLGNSVVDTSRTKSLERFGFPVWALPYRSFVPVCEPTTWSLPYGRVFARRTRQHPEQQQHVSLPNAIPSSPPQLFYGATFLFHYFLLIKLDKIKHNYCTPAGMQSWVVDTTAIKFRGEGCGSG
jgi:hypothetical protein